MEEIFKPVKNFEQRFEISNFGRLLSINGKFRGRTILKLHIDTFGYYSTTLRMKPLKRRLRVHTLVAETFIDKSNPTLWVNHKDGNKLNNRVDNLEWCTPAENCKHAVENGLMNIKGSKHPNAKLSEDDVLQIRSSFLSVAELSELYNIGKRHIRDILNKVNWKHI